MGIKSEFSVSEAYRLAGFRSPHMLDYLFRSGLVRPSVSARPGRGKKRLYNFEDVLLLKAFRVILSQGISVKKLRAAQKEFKKHDLGAEEKKFPVRYMVTDGASIYYVDDLNRTINLSEDGQFAFAFILDMEPITSELYEDALKLSA